MARILEVVTRWDDTLLDVVVVADGYAIAGIDIVRDGKLVGEATGHIGHVAYSVEPIERRARTMRFARGDGRRILPYVAAMLAVHLGLWAQATASDREDRDDRAPGRLARARSTKRSFAHGDHVPPREPGDDATHGSTARGQGMAMKGAAGAAGADAPIAPRGHVAVKNLGEEVQLSKGELLEQARHAGILGHAAVI